MTPVLAFIGLGANLGDAEATLRSATAALRHLPDSRFMGLSSLFRSAPLGPAGQPDYLNAVAGLYTQLTPHGLLAALQAIEDSHGRIRRERWGARTLDLDLLLYGSDRIATPELTVPHSELDQRNFVVVPLLELAPDLVLPDGRRLSNLSKASDYAGLALQCAGAGWGD